MKNHTSKNLFMLAASAGMVLFCAASNAGTFKNITIDGSFGDWAGVPLLASDPADSTTSVDYSDIYVANDDNYLYIRFKLHTAGDPFTSINNIFVDADNNTGTGYNAGGYVGSEMLIQSGAGYQERLGGFNEGDISGLGWAAAPTGVGTEFEVRISRSATYATNNMPVFTNATIAFVLEAENTSYTPQEWAPGVVGGITYTFESAPTPLTTNITLVTLANTSWQVNGSGTDLGAAWLDQTYDDTQAGWSGGMGLFGFTTSPGSYPPINTALSSGPTTYYFRTHLQWANLVDNVAFVVTNYLSDGAVFYLNGAEVRRVRMPAGAIGYNTNATGVAAPVGKVEVFGISGGPLFIGDNILEVETHQAPASATDMVLGLSLTAAAQYPVLNVDTNLPANQSVVAGQSVTLTTDVIGSGPLSRQWYKNGVSIPGATNANLTIPVVLTNDAAGYALVTTNAYGSNMTRTAVLTVTATPVVLDDPAQPADAFVVEAHPVTLSVVASGSPVIHYQWFKNASPIPDATNATYTIASAVLTNTGNYSVSLNNPASSTNSRTASLTVLKDIVAPAVTAISASANQIVVSFSSLLNPASANTAGNYALSGGLTITGAVIDSGDNSKVTLTTSSAMTLGTVYQLGVNGVSDLFGNAIHTKVSFTRTITIDGAFDDWQGIAPIYSGPIGSPGAADFKDIYLYNDASKYYFRVTLWQDIPPENGQFPFYVNMLFDTDNNSGTGFSAVGSELLIQSGFSYQQKNGGFNEGSINNLNWTCLPAVPGTNFEFSFSRAATFASDSTSVFTTNVLNFLFQGMTPGFVPLNLAPASGVLSFTNSAVVNVAPLPLGLVGIQALSGKRAALEWETAGSLQAKGSLTSGSWTNVPGASSPYVIPAAGNQLFFRLAQ